MADGQHTHASDPAIVAEAAARIAADNALSARIAALEGAVPPVQPPDVPPSSPLGYGSIASDTKANIRVGADGNLVAHRFRASTTSALRSVRFSQRGGPVYSAGTGGTMTISVRADNGGVPAGVPLASFSYTPGNPGGSWTTYLALPFPSPAVLTAGQLYHLCFANSDASNYISVNELFVYGSDLVPRQPLYPDSDYAVLIDGEVQGGYTAVMDLFYADGTHDGMGYIGAMIEQFGTISGSSKMVREQFTVSGPSRTVRSASVRVRRSSGSSPLTLTLETSTGTLIEAVAIPASSVPVSAPGGDNGGAVWVTATFAAAHVLASGSSYNLRLSTPSDTIYTTFPVLQGTSVGFGSPTFTDGDGQVTTNGSNWANLYLYDSVDIQFWLK